jgi:hypothetical protein
MKEKIKKYLPFWLGLFITVGLIGHFAATPSFAALSAFVVGYFITNINK